MPIKVFIHTLQKSQDTHKISFSFEFNNKNIKKVVGANLPPPPPDTIQLDLPPDTIRVNKLIQSDRIFPLNKRAKVYWGGGHWGNFPSPLLSFLRPNINLLNFKRKGKGNKETTENMYVKMYLFLYRLFRI